MSAIAHEVASQPDVWRRAAGCASAAPLPAHGARVAAVGCGTSLYVAQAYAASREAAGRGETDAFPASEFPAGRRYDVLLAISRSGTTTEVLDLLRRVDGAAPSVAVTASADTPIAGLATIAGDRLSLDALLLSPDGAAERRGSLVGPMADAAGIGTALGEQLRRDAGSEFGFG